MIQDFLNRVHVGRPCAHCGKPIPPKSRRFCSGECRREWTKDFKRKNRSSLCRGCGKLLPTGRMIWCSDKCRRHQARYKMKNSETVLAARSMAEMRAATCDMKPRTCLGLGCGVTFISEGPQNRRCGKCKASDAVGPSLSFREEVCHNDYDTSALGEWF